MKVVIGLFSIMKKKNKNKDYNNCLPIMKKKKRKKDYNKPLPMELIEEILSWVPCKDLVRFKCVSRSWYELVKDPKFFQLHLARSRSHSHTSSFLFESFSAGLGIFTNYQGGGGGVFSRLSLPPSDNKSPVVLRVEGTCDGLICYRFVSGNFDINFLIYNPTTRLSKTILSKALGPTWVLGFGYDSVSDDYKVLFSSTSTLEMQQRLQWQSRRRGGWSIGIGMEDEEKIIGGGDQKSMMYGLKTNAWEPVENPPWNFWLICHSSAPCVNNSFHWLLPKPGTGGKEIKCFHLRTRTYSEMPLPETICNIPSCVLTVINNGQQLCLCVVTNSLDIWVLKEYGNHKSWTQLFRNKSPLTLINIASPFSDLWCLDLRLACFQDQRNNNFILIVTPIPVGATPALWFYCDVQSQKTTKMEMPDCPNYLGLAALQPWVESLVPLH